MIPRTFYTPRVVTGRGAQHRPVSPALSPTGQAHHPPSVAWLSSARTPRMVGRQVWTEAEGPSMGSKPLGVPLGHLVDHSPHCHWAALSREMLCFFAFLCDAAPQLLLGRLGSLLVLHGPTIDGETLLLY